MIDMARKTWVAKVALAAMMVAGALAKSAQGSQLPHAISPPPQYAFSKVAAADCPVGSECYGLSGKVHVQVIVNSLGVPVSVKAVSGDSRLWKAVEAAVMKFRFRFMAAPTNNLNTSFDFIVRAQQ